jgi:hypothetical protein
VSQPYGPKRPLTGIALPLPHCNYIDEWLNHLGRMENDTPIYMYATVKMFAEHTNTSLKPEQIWT